MTKNASLLNELILSKHRSIKDFCLTTGIADDVVNNVLEQDLTQAPAAVLFKMCRALGVDAEELVESRLRFCTYEQRQQAWAEYNRKRNGSIAD